MRVLGIDPGTAATGYGVVAVHGVTLHARGFGVIMTPAGEAPERRLATIFGRVGDLLEEHRPVAVALEDLYVGANPRTVLSVGQARGTVLAACGLAAVEASGYAPADVKQTVCGFGRASKDQVARMVRVILSLTEPDVADHATDALAVAICHAQRARSRAPAAAGRAS